MSWTWAEILQSVHVDERHPDMFCTLRMQSLRHHEPSCLLTHFCTITWLQSATAANTPTGPVELTSVSTAPSLVMLSSAPAGWFLPLRLCWADKRQDPLQCSELGAEARYSSVRFRRSALWFILTSLPGAILRGCFFWVVFCLHLTRVTPGVRSHLGENLLRWLKNVYFSEIERRNCEGLGLLQDSGALAMSSNCAQDLKLSNVFYVFLFFNVKHFFV